MMRRRRRTDSAIKSSALFVLAALVPAFAVVAVETRYLSADGSDSADGLTPSTAWRTVERLNAALPAGGHALLRRGDTFYGSLKPKSGVDADHRTTISAYGKGPKPVVSCTRNLRHDPKIWSRVQDVPSLWRVDLRTMANTTGLNSTNSNPGFLLVDGVVKPWKHFTRQTIAKDWDFSDEGGFLYVCAPRNPAEIASDIRMAVNAHGVLLASHLAVSNIAVHAVGAHGMVGGWGWPGRMSDIRISDCDFENIGGSELVGYKGGRVRYGNGVEFGNDVANARVERCAFRGVYDVAFTMQGYPKTSWADIVVSDCEMKECAQAFEIWCMNAPKGVGYERCAFVGNRICHVGGGWGALTRPNKNVATPLLMYRLDTDVVDIEVSGNTFEDAPLGLIYKYGGFSKIPAGYRIRGNIFRTP